MKMQRFIFCYLILISLTLMASCQISQEKVISTKNKCYSNKLAELKLDSIYLNVVSQFNDTFNILKDKKEFFGVPEYVETELDEAVFFNSDKSKCLLIILKRMSDNVLFGSARIIDGEMINGKWLFEINLEYNFEKAYFNLFHENNFENISMLARYSVLTAGEIRTLEGCEIDENYWFNILEK